MISKNLMKLIRSLEQKKARLREGLFVAEGPKVVGDLIRHGWQPQRIVATREWMEANPGLPADEATEDELRRVSFLQHPQQVLALFPLPLAETEADIQLPARELCLALDGVQDPGNVGTIIRLADWFGISCVYCSQDTADAFSPKVVQATMGSIARVHIIYCDLPELIGHLPEGCPVYGTLLDGNDLYTQELTPNGLLVMGNEGKGISEAVRGKVTHKLLIPRFGSETDGAESLNVAIATAVACSEFKRRITAMVLTVAAALFCCLPAGAQELVRMHLHEQDTTWTFPYEAEQADYMDFDDTHTQVRLHTVDGEKQEGQTVTFDAEALDSLTIETDDEDHGKDHYKTFAMYLTTRDGASIDSKEVYTDCFVSIDGRGEFSDYSGSGGIRGRGNSTWEWYDKKPYKLKLDEKHKLLGLKKAKKWVLLANYRDPTDLMNTFAFETAEWMGMPSTNHTRYVEVFLNGDYIGVYQLTEQIEQGKNRVDVNEAGGFLLNIDLDDGPGLSPEATDNFYSEVYELPICVKYPDEPTKEQLDSIKVDFAVLERAVKARDYVTVDSLMDVDAFISMLQLQELLYNVDFTAPRSTYMYKDPQGKYTMGPVWDWDAGYDFDWSNMYTGHDFFASSSKLMMGTEPYRQNGTYTLPKFYTALFGSKEFVARYKQRWATLSDSIFTRNWATTMRYVDNLRQGVFKREAARWPIGKDTDTEIERMRKWLQARTQLLTTTIAAYPDDYADTGEAQLAGTIKVAQTLDYNSGYSQSSKISIDKAKVASLVGLSQRQLSSTTGIEIVPLNTDGTEGDNNTSGTYGGWFNADNNPRFWDGGHVFIEVYDDLYSWTCGLRNAMSGGECASGHVHKVTMQYHIPVGNVTKAVNVEVTMTVE